MEPLLYRIYAIALALAACHAPVASTRPTMPDEQLRFDIRDGNIDNHFFRQGPIAAHLLASSGPDPRLIVAFPAGNTGIALWFRTTTTPVAFDIDGPLTPITDHAMHGIAATLVANTGKLVVRRAVLGSIRTIREAIYVNKVPPQIAHETTTSQGGAIELRRTTVDGSHHILLRLEPTAGTTAALEDGALALTSPTGTIHVRATALADDEPLTPIPTTSLVTIASPDPRDLRALAFLSYREKLLAGSWRFLTYFGRDTLITVRLLMPVLQPDVIEASLGAVLDRLAPDGNVAHEEELADFAALHHTSDPHPPTDLRTPIYDYEMVDDDFMLAPIAAAYLLDTADGKARAAAFLARKTPTGQTYAQALARNLELVIKRATPYARDPIATNLVALEPGNPVGQWRDSPSGLGNGRYPFDINVALVPAALDAAARLADSHLLAPAPAAADTSSTTARELATAWRDVATLFRIELPAAQGASLVQSYATTLGIDPTDAMAALGDRPLVFHAIALDNNGQPIPIMHTDSGFALLFTNPSLDYLQSVAGQLQRAFPAGLRTPIGIVVANPAFAPDDHLRTMFMRGKYHGTVVWSWQQALLAAGLERQLARTDLPAPTRDALVHAQTALWDVIDATADQRGSELWTWDVKDHHIIYAPFGQSAMHADESNAVQLWSTVYLGVRRPSRR